MCCIKKSVAVILSLMFFGICVSKHLYADTDQKGAKIEIRLTEEIPLLEETDSGSQWFKKHKWWVLGGLLAVVVIGAAAGGGGGDSSGGGGGSDSDGGTDTAGGAGSGTVSW